MADVSCVDTICRKQVVAYENGAILEQFDPARQAVALQHCEVSLLTFSKKNIQTKAKYGAMSLYKHAKAMNDSLNEVVASAR